jgi:hypothetical protein
MDRNVQIFNILNNPMQIAKFLEILSEDEKESLFEEIREVIPDYISCLYDFYIITKCFGKVIRDLIFLDMSSLFRYVIGDSKDAIYALKVMSEENKTFFLSNHADKLLISHL